MRKDYPYRDAGRLGGAILAAVVRYPERSSGWHRYIRCVVYRYQAPFVDENVGVVEFDRPHEGEVGLFGRELHFELFEDFGRVPGLAELAVDRRRL
jgi:hypothetical protein